jgi:hypothetical protein
LLYDGFAKAMDWVDKTIVDGVVRLIDRLVRNIAKVAAHMQTGQLQVYGVCITIGILTMLGIYFFLR